MMSNLTQGALYAHIAISKLVLNIKRVGSPLVQQAQASNKKTANAQCALYMIRELYRRNLIEKFGEKRISSRGMAEVENLEKSAQGGKSKLDLSKLKFWIVIHCIFI